jgi:hypothetical protein
MAALGSRDCELAGEEFNLGSPKQLGDILFGKMGLPGGKKTKTGAWATPASCWKSLPPKAMNCRARCSTGASCRSSSSTYTDALPGYQPETGPRAHQLSLAATTTGRLSSSEPNLQNIPVRTEAGRKIRKAFIAEKGCKLVSADYSQIELRVLAHVADIDAAETGLRRRPRHSRHDGFGDVRRAHRRHGPDGPPPGQGDQFRHHLRHFRLRPRQPAGHRSRARKPATISRPISSASPASSDYMDDTKAFAASTAMWRRSSGANAHYPT